MSNGKIFKDFGFFYAIFLGWSFAWIDTEIVKANVGLFVDKERESKENLLWVVSNFTSKCYSRNTTNCVQLDIEVVYLDEVPFSRISSIFCSSILKTNVVAIVAHTKCVRTTQILASMASYFAIPVIGTATESPLLSEKVSIFVILLFYNLQKLTTEFQGRHFFTQPLFDMHDVNVFG